MRFFSVTRTRVDETHRSLEAACRSREVDFVAVSPSAIWRPMTVMPAAGDLLYRAATDIAAERAEALLLGPGVATFHAAPGFICSDHLATFVRAGLPVPRTVFNIDGDARTLRGCVDALGGFPVVLKEGGTEGGRGVHLIGKIDELADRIASLSGPAILQDLVEHDHALRLVVIGGRVVAAHAASPPRGDFRSNVPGAVARAAEPPAEAEALAVRAVELLGLEFGGVDVMVGRGGELALAEVNFPCHFPTTEELTGIDVAGAMVDHLAAKAATLE